MSQGSSSPDFPPFSSLPIRTGQPAHSCWIWGENDDLGTLNLLTPERRLAATKEVRSGLSISLNWDFAKPERPLFNRPPITHEVISKPGRPVFDDQLVFNTQSGTQIDGLRHFGYPGEIFYNGVTGDQIREAGSRRLGLDAAAQDGIVGRGILIDFASYAQANGITFDPVNTYKITVDQLEAVLKAQGTTPQTGDILLVRTGFVERYEAAGDEEKISWQRPPVWTGSGVEPSEKTLEWLYSHHFAAVGGDAPTFEAWPAGKGDLQLHPPLLAGWGTLIYEMLDLRRLAEECRRAQRWSFLFTSAPLNVRGGVGSPGP